MSVFSDKSTKVKTTERQRLFLKIKAENPGWTDSKCARQAGYSEGYVRSAKVAKNCKQTLIEIMHEKGITGEYITQKILEGTRAYSKKYIKISKPGRKREEFIIEKTDPDFNVRHKYLDLVTDIRGDKVQVVKNLHEFPEGIPINIPAVEQDRINKELKKFFNVSSQTTGGKHGTFEGPIQHDLREGKEREKAGKGERKDKEGSSVMGQKKAGNIQSGKDKKKRNESKESKKDKGKAKTEGH